jgi:hypothetical protein
MRSGRISSHLQKLEIVDGEQIVELPHFAIFSFGITLAFGSESNDRLPVPVGMRPDEVVRGRSYDCRLISISDAPLENKASTASIENIYPVIEMTEDRIHMALGSSSND